MLEARSAVAILYLDSTDDKLFLLLNYPSGHWDFVKGNIEKDENLKQTVLREIKEETGISQVNFVDDFEDKIEYYYQRDGELVHKEVIFFLATTTTREVTLSDEHLDYTWLTFSDAIKKLTYKSAQKLLRKIKEL